MKTTKKILNQIASFAKLLKRKRLFDVYTATEMESSYEPDNCPSRWKGSGCYDISIYANRYQRILVCARSAGQAIDAVERLEKDSNREWRDYLNKTIPIRPDTPRFSFDQILGAIQSQERPDKDFRTGQVIDWDSHEPDYEEWSTRETEPTLEEAAASF